MISTDQLSVASIFFRNPRRFLPSPPDTGQLNACAIRHTGQSIALWLGHLPKSHEGDIRRPQKESDVREEDGEPRRHVEKVHQLHRSPIRARSPHGRHQIRGQLPPKESTPPPAVHVAPRECGEGEEEGVHEGGHDDLVDRDFPQGARQGEASDRKESVEEDEPVVYHQPWNGVTPNRHPGATGGIVPPRRGARGPPAATLETLCDGVAGHGERCSRGAVRHDGVPDEGVAVEAGRRPEDGERRRHRDQAKRVAAADGGGRAPVLPPLTTARGVGACREKDHSKEKAARQGYSCTEAHCVLVGDG